MLVGSLGTSDGKQRRAWGGRGALVSSARDSCLSPLWKIWSHRVFSVIFSFPGCLWSFPCLPWVGGGQRPLKTGRCWFQRHRMAMSSASSGLIRPPVVLSWVPRRLPSLPSLRVVWWGTTSLPCFFVYHSEPSRHRISLAREH